MITTAIIKKTGRDKLYTAAVTALSGIQQLIKLDKEGVKIEDIIEQKNTFQKITSEKNSPSVLWLAPDEYIMYYPPYSSPCPQKPNEKALFVEVLRGEIYCSNRDMVFKENEKIKMLPLDDYIPYTRNKECYLRVKVGYPIQEIKDVLG
jgi:hypothetical protein